MLLRGGPEVDEEVTARDQVELRKRGIFEQVVARKHYRMTQLRHYLQAAVRAGDEVLSAPTLVDIRETLNRISRSAAGLYSKA